MIPTVLPPCGWHRVVPQGGPARRRPPDKKVSQAVAFQAPTVLRGTWQYQPCPHVRYISCHQVATRLRCDLTWVALPLFHQSTILEI